MSLTGYSGDYLLNIFKLSFVFILMTLHSNFFKESIFRVCRCSLGPPQLHGTSGNVGVGETQLECRWIQS